MKSQIIPKGGRFRYALAIIISLILILILIFNFLGARQIFDIKTSLSEISLDNLPQIISTGIGLLLIIAVLISYIRSENEKRMYYRAIQSTIRSLKESYQYLSKTFVSIGDAIIATNNKGLVTFLNPAAEKLTGFTSDEAINKDIDLVFKVINLDNGGNSESLIESVLSQKQNAGKSDHLVLVARDGSEIPVDYTGAPIKDDDGKVNGMVLVFHDVSESRKAAQKIEHLNAVLKAIRNVNQLITKEKDIEKLIQGSCESLIDARGFRSSWIALTDEDENIITFSHSGTKQGCHPEMPLENLGQMPECGCLSLQKSEPILISEEQDYCQACFIKDKNSDDGALSIRLEHNNKVYGVLTVSIPMPLARMEEEQELFKEVAGDIGFALYSIELEGKRIQAESGLRESEHQLRNVIEAFPLGMHFYEIEKDQENPHLVFAGANKAADDILGIENSQFIGKTIAEAFPPLADSEIPKRYWDAAENGETWRTEQVEYKHHQIAGAYSVVAFQTAPGKMAATFEDITEKKKSQFALEESERKYRSLFSNMMDAFAYHEMIYDESNRPIDYRFLEINDAFEKMTGLSRADIIGKTVLEVIPEIAHDDYDWIGEYGIIAQERGVLSFEQFSKSLNKWYRIHAYSPHPDHFACQFEDITQRKEAEQALRESEEQYRRVFGSVADCLVISDYNGNIIHANESACATYGYALDELTKLSAVDLIRSDNHFKFEEMQKSIKETGHYSGETIDIRKDGSTLNTQVRVSNINIKGKEYLLAVIRDVTETKRLQDFAVRAQRLETAGRIASQVAHDFNNLLGPLVAFPDLVRDELPGDHPVLTYVDSMEKSARKIADINQQLLTLGRRGHYSLSPLNLNLIIREVLEQFKIIPDKVEMKPDLEDNLMNISAGPAQIFRVISNLVYNANESMPDGGQLKIRTENFYVENITGKLGLIPQGEYVKCSIIDSGTGISPEAESKIFDPFFSTKKTDKRRGSGLGLSVVHAVVEDHNGYIDFESSPGGTAFYLYFPITRENIDIEISSDHIVGGDEQILIVDDDEDQLDVCRKLLEKLGYRTELVESGEKALDILQTSTPDLILLDMIMPPGMDGAETYKKIIDLNPEQKAIIVSGFARTVRVKFALELGAASYIRKPLTIESLAMAVRNALDNAPRS